MSRTYTSGALPAGTRPSPNIWHHTETYELENRAVDHERRLEQAMRAVADWRGRRVLDLGCGAGFHLPRWADTAAGVVGVEPHPRLAAMARVRCVHLPRVQVRQGTAQRIPLPDASIDVAHARWAYFFGPGCEPGLAELERVLKRGGTAFVIDIDATRSTVGAWFRTARPDYDAAAVERFWSVRGWTREPVDLTWRFDDRADLERVVRIEFAPSHADRFLAAHGGLEVDYATNLWWRRH
jgi:SAM-dependent methyltransferase